MTSRPRPYIPLAVRVKVAARQLAARHLDNYGALAMLKISEQHAGRKLADLLLSLFGEGANLHLDHDPPLRARTFNPRTGRYTPDANDPDHLIYRTDVDHRRKTNLRGDGAQFPDRVLIKREKRREKATQREIATQGRPSHFGPGRKWPSGRKITSRGFQ